MATGGGYMVAMSGGLGDTAPAVSLQNAMGHAQVRRPSPPHRTDAFVPSRCPRGICATYLGPLS